MTSSALEAPLVFAAAALDLCGVQIDQIAGEVLSPLSDGDFRLRFDLARGIELQLDHDAGSQTYRVSVLFVPRPSHAAETERLALQLNSLHDGTRRYALDGQSQAIVLTESFALTPELSVDALAASVAELIQAVDALQNTEASLATVAPATGLMQSLSLRA